MPPQGPLHSTYSKPSNYYCLARDQSSTHCSLLWCFICHTLGSNDRIALHHDWQHYTCRYMYVIATSKTQQHYCICMRMLQNTSQTFTLTSFSLPTTHLDSKSYGQNYYNVLQPRNICSSHAKFPKSVIPEQISDQSIICRVKRRHKMLKLTFQP